MKIAHFYAMTPNLGDAGAARGIQNLIRSIQGDIQFEEFNIQKKDLGISEIKRINSECDALILGGGGLFYNVSRTSSLFNFNIKYRHYSKLLEIPKGFFAIGINAEYSEKAKWNISRETINNIKMYINETALVSVRDLETIQFLKSIGIDNAYLTPCPSMFLLKDLNIGQKDDTFALNLTKRSSSYDDLILITQNALEYSKLNKIEPILIVHHKKEDQACMEIARSFGIRVYIPTSPENMMEFYKKQQFLIGMRGHSLIFASGAHIPMISLSYNIKCDAHMQLINMQDYNIETKDITNKRFLFEKLENLQANRETITKNLRMKTEEFFAKNLEYTRSFLAII